MTNVIDIREARAQMTTPFKARTLTPDRDTLPESIRQCLKDDFIGVYEGRGGWIALCRDGFVFTVAVMQTGRDSYDYECLHAEPINAPRPPEAA